MRRGVPLPSQLGSLGEERRKLPQRGLGRPILGRFMYNFLRFNASLVHLQPGNGIFLHPFTG